MDTLTIEDIPYTEGPFVFPETPTVQDTLDYPDFQSVDELINILDPEDPLSDLAVWSFCNETDNDAVAETAGPGPSGEANSHSGAIEVFNFPDSSVPGDHSVQIPSHNCICCQRLRVITHTNGVNVKRLEIHGCLGVITHAVLEIYSFDSSLNNQETLMFDFQKDSLGAVKKFLIQHFEICKQEGYRTLQDPLLSFYQAISVGLNDPGSLSDFVHSSPENAGDCPSNQQETLRRMQGGNSHGDIAKIPLAMQRERTRNLKLKDVSNYFNLPIEDAARKLNICPTVMKKICRRNGMLRWPYRKIKSLERKISNNVQVLDSCHGEERAQLLENIQKHQKELDDIYEEFAR